MNITFKAFLSALQLALVANGDAGEALKAFKPYFPAIGDNRGKASNKVDAVKALLTSYGKLSTAEKRRFLSAIQ